MNTRQPIIHINQPGAAPNPHRSGQFDRQVRPFPVETIRHQGTSQDVINRSGPAQYDKTVVHARAPYQLHGKEQNTSVFNPWVSAGSSARFGAYERVTVPVTRFATKDATDLQKYLPAYQHGNRSEVWIRPIEVRPAPNSDTVQYNYTTPANATWAGQPENRGVLQVRNRADVDVWTRQPTPHFGAVDVALGPGLAPRAIFNNIR